MSDIVERLRNLGNPVTHDAAHEIEQLRAENEDLRRWKAMGKPLTAAMAIVNSDMQKLRAEIKRLEGVCRRYRQLTGMKVEENPKK